MKVSVELMYKAMLSDREVKTIQEAGHVLTSSRTLPRHLHPVWEIAAPIAEIGKHLQIS